MTTAALVKSGWSTGAVREPPDGAARTLKINRRREEVAASRRIRVDSPRRTSTVLSLGEGASLPGTEIPPSCAGEPGVNDTASITVKDADGNVVLDVPGGPLPGGVPGSERDAYTAAFNQMKNRQFDEAVAAFNALVMDYPNGQFTPNAFYWLGELHLAQAQDEMARESFSQVINLYPDHQKVPDALYKLGIVYHRLGDKANALQYLERVTADYPQSSAAGLARTYSAEIR